MKKFQVFKGFSLVELLVTLIIISLLIAAFMPLITKKLKANDITVGSFGKGDVVNTILERQVTKADCEKYDAIFVPAGINGGTRNLCVTKYNMGDNNLALAKSAKSITAGGSCSNSDIGNCCFKGQTSSGCGNDGNEGSNYSGCNRTVCQWSAANASCSAYAPNDENEGRWRLPKKDEIASWGNNLTAINNNLGVDGLQLCDKDSSTNGAVKCSEGTNKCSMQGSDGNCNPYSIWSINSEADKSYFSSSLASGNFSTNSSLYSIAASTRCVLDSIEVELSDISGITNPTTNPFYGEPQNQEDCDKIVAIFIDKKYSGANRNICVSKYNVGDAGPDGFGPPIPSEFEQYTMAVGQSCTYSGSCCWKGKTSSTCGLDGNEGANYSGCNRTVCQWNAANAACRQYTAFGATKAGAWRLPKSSETAVWAQHLDVLNNNLGADGLQLCSRATLAGYVGCTSGASCNGSFDNGCWPNYLWTSTSLGSVYATAYDSLISASHQPTYAFSARCVYDGITTADNNSSSDLDDYDDSNAPSDEPKSQEDCDKLTSIFVHKKYAGGARNLCVSKYNVGDSGPSGSGPAIPSSYTNYIMNVSQSCTYSGYCCWKGKTSATCGMTGNVGANYSGCNRTVCQWQAANESCLSWTAGGKTQVGAWRLPTQAELASMASYLNILQVDRGSDGLQLCSRATLAGYVGCTSGAGCNGSFDNGCWPNYLWTSTSLGSVYATAYDSLISASHQPTYAFSARCVYDGTVKKTDTYEDYDDSNAPTDEPKSQADCDNLIAIFIHKKYSGGMRNVCVSKYNVGDTGASGSGPTIASEYKQYALSVGQTCSKSGYCCWSGKTSTTCGLVGNAGANYSGCNRTVCQWNVADASCKSYTANGKTKAGYWRLPTNFEFSSWANYLEFFNNNKGKDGLQLCSNSAIAGYVGCTSGAGCNGSFGNGCWPNYLWTSTSLGSVYATAYDSLISASHQPTYAFGARCVYDGLDYSGE